MRIAKPPVVVLFSILIALLAAGLLGGVYLARSRPSAASPAPPTGEDVTADISARVSEEVSASDTPWGSPVTSSGPVRMAADPAEPASIEIDDEGYTIWTYKYPDTWCVMFSRIMFPFDLAAQDASQLSDTSLKLTFEEWHYWQSSPYEDATWSVALNGDPGPYVDDTWTGDWNIIGAIGTTPQKTAAVPVTQEIAFDATELSDGENRLQFRQHDFCYCDNPHDCACTCYELSEIQLRGAVNLAVHEMLPADGTERVSVDQNADSQIQIQFTTVISEPTLSEETFLLYYHDEEANEVYVDGTVREVPGSRPRKYAFVPAQPLMPGVRYVAEVVGEEDAYRLGRDAWVTDVGGGPLAKGARRVFWTMPNIQVDLVPVQVLDNEPLVQDKPTALRVFIRWDRQPGVHPRSIAPDVEIDDVTVFWVADGGQGNQQSWRDGGDWVPAWDAKSGITRHRREYLEFTDIRESYRLIDKRRLLDSFNYFGFTPDVAATHTFAATVWVTDSRGKRQPFKDVIPSHQVYAAQPVAMRVYPMAVGSDFGKTGTKNLSDLVTWSAHGVRALFPTPRVIGPAASSRLAYMPPTDPGYDWTTPPGWWGGKTTALLADVETLCAAHTPCTGAVGVVPTTWLDSPGVTYRESSPRAMLVWDNTASEARRYIVAHEYGHLASIDNHYQGPAASGFHVARRDVKNAEQGYVDFMTPIPVEEGFVYLWTNQSHFSTVRTWLGSTPSAVAASAPPEPAWTAEPRLLVRGSITLTNDALTLSPWYQLEAGEYNPSTPGPYRIVFLDGSGQPIAGFTRSFAVGTTLRYAVVDETTTPVEVGSFAFTTPYPSATVRVQIRKDDGGAGKLLAEIVPSATAPTVSIDTPSKTTWTGTQNLTWQAGASADNFMLSISTDNGATWHALGLDLTAKSFTLDSSTFPNTDQALIRLRATDGLRTATDIAGPFTIDNPPLVDYVSPPAGTTDVGVRERVVAGFRDAMRASSLTNATFKLTGPAGTVPGAVTYDAESREATFAPAVPLAYATTYTARVTTGVRDASGEALPAAKSWSFTTEADEAPPTPRLVSPVDGAVGVALDARPTVAWDEPLDAATLNPTTFKLATADGAPVAGAVSYDAATQTASFTPAADLAPGTLYVATLGATIADPDGNTMGGTYTWAFTTGFERRAGMTFTGAYADEGVDTNADGLFEELVIRAGVEVTATGSYALHGVLVDAAGGRIAEAQATASLDAGAHVLRLAFDGDAIGGHGVDGPYTLTELALTRNDGATDPTVLAAISANDAYRTAAYPVNRFPAPLRLSGLPDVIVPPGTTSLTAFNIHDYADHESLPADGLDYAVMLDSQPEAGVELLATGAVRVTPTPYWLGLTRVTIRASDGTYTAQDTFTVLVGWPEAVYLPTVTRLYDAAAAAQSTRDAWITLIDDDFESSTLGWSTYAWISTPPYGPGGWYFWDRSDCAAHSGQYSAWPYGAGEDGELLPCGANYPDTLGSMLYKAMPVDLSYVGRAEYRAMVWTDLAPGDEVCLKVSTETWNNCNGGAYYGVCRTGQTGGWEELALDLADVPTLGNLLGTEEVCVAVTFQADESENRPAGAYVDDVSLRICPEGLEDYCR